MRLWVWWIVAAFAAAVCKCALGQEAAVSLEALSAQSECKAFQSSRPNITDWDAQCDRSPPCLNLGFFFKWPADYSVCRSLPKVTDWPTYDPYEKDTASQRSAKDIAQLLPNRTVLYLGDSVSYQVYYSTICSLARADAWAEHHPQEGELKSALYKAGAAWAQVNYAPESATTFLFARVSVYNEGIVSNMLALADVIHVNYGLHYTQQTSEDYVFDVTKLFQQLNQFAANPSKLALFRETSAQHFPASGAFDKSNPAHKSDCMCEQLSKAAKADNYIMRQNSVVHWLAYRHPNVKVVPFYERTSVRHNMHFQMCDPNRKKDTRAADSGCCDCTHYCWTPQLWNAVMADVYNALTEALEAAHADLELQTDATFEDTDTDSLLLAESLDLDSDLDMTLGNTRVRSLREREREMERGDYRHLRAMTSEMWFVVVLLLAVACAYYFLHRVRGYKARALWLLVSPTMRTQRRSPMPSSNNTGMSVAASSASLTHKKGVQQINVPSLGGADMDGLARTSSVDTNALQRTPRTPGRALSKV
eukprot:jgi/Chlat1/654/Chrsp103S01054